MDIKQILGVYRYERTRLLAVRDNSGKTIFVGTAQQVRRRLKLLFGRTSFVNLLHEVDQAGFSIGDAQQLSQNNNAQYTIRMADLKDKVKALPKQPGVYLFKDKDGRVIYVGKAKNLKNRVSQYFGHDTRPQLPYLMQDAVDLDYTVVNSELESLFLENTLIKEYLPQYNIKLRDDKNYAFITIDYTTQIPSIGYARKVDTKKGTRYFGPYSSTRKIRQTLDFVRRVFPYCSNTQIGKRPCFYYFLHRCPGVCIGQISLEDYNKELERIILFLSGKNEQVKKELKTNMKQAARQKHFELAARLRDQLRAIEVLDERQTTIFPSKVSWDFVSVYIDTDTACVNLFRVREGKLIDKEDFIYNVGPNGEGKTQDIIQKFLESYYAETSDIPREIYIQGTVGEVELIKSLLQQRAGHKVPIAVPTRGKKLQLINLGKTNAQEYLKKWQRSQATNIDTINEALETLKDVLKLPTLPRRIEGYDISNIQGTNPVGSMVVVKDGLPAKSEYRKFKINVKQTPDDFAMMEEMLTRRLARVTSDQLPVTSQSKDTWPTPDLLVIDGGKGQLGVAVKVLKEKRLHIPVVGLAKRIEEIFVPGKSKPIILSHDQPALQMLQRLRDEAHRFGITFHRDLRSKQAVKSAIDDIPGIGPKTKKLLKEKFGTVAQIRQAALDDLTTVIGKQKAELVKKYL